jgi:uncharacterized integral membrane protein
MSAPSGQIPLSSGAKGAPQKAARSRSERARTGAMILLAVLMTLFAVLNVKSVRVNWIFGSGEVPLIIVIAISLLVGIVLTHFAERRGRKRA